ncbi:hypothetical protein PIB30_049014 [Stylosanthes scabra]|uniref:Uncharacterized protein n=1 Tax=Stylosanthes scabra TaxID=79078 RepID=A0ABU6QH30_9FABA|nr:hypothetical protein [Stylosanthes scabra]
MDLLSEAKAARRMAVVVVGEGVPMNYPLHMPEVLDMAGDSDGPTVVVEAVLILGVLQKLHEERVVEVHEWNHEPLLLFSLMTNLYRQTPLGHQPLLSLLPHLLRVSSSIKTREHTQHCLLSRSTTQFLWEIDGFYAVDLFVEHLIIDIWHWVCHHSHESL